MNERISFVGVGRMGANMARRLKDCGYFIACAHDADEARAAALASELGCKGAESLAALTKASDVVFTVISDDAAMKGIFEGGLLERAEGKLFINCATLSPEVHQWAESKAREAGAQALEACMASSIPQARNGELYLMCGGRREVFERAEPILAKLGASVRYIGASGKAAQVKAIVNMLMNVHTAALAEGLALGASLGLDLGMLREVLSQTGANSRVLHTDGEDMQNREHSCFFSASHAAKDSAIALRMTQQQGIAAPVAEASCKQYHLMVQLGLGELDKSGVAELTFKERIGSHHSSVTASNPIHPTSPEPDMETNRRKFLKTAGASLALASAPAFLGAADDKRNPILGTGEHTYECIHDWGELPADIRYGNTHGVCEDSQGRIYIKHTVGAGSQKPDAVVVFDAEGKFITSWGSEFKGGAHGLHWNREGSEEFLYLADPNRGLVVKTTLKGEDVFRLRYPEESQLYNKPEEYRPTNVATAPNGDFYVSDGYGKSWIHQYDKKASYIRSFGGPGKERGQTLCSHGLMVDTRSKEPLLVVADRTNRRLQIFTLEGRHIAFVTDEMRAPCHFHLRGKALLVPDLEARVTILDEDNKLITHLGDGTHYAGIRDKGREAFTPGKFVAPHGACFDHQGNIFVVEWVEVGRVTKLRKVA